MTDAAGSGWSGRGPVWWTGLTASLAVACGFWGGVGALAYDGLFRQPAAAAEAASRAPRPEAGVTFLAVTLPEGQVASTDRLDRLRLAASFSRSDAEAAMALAGLGSVRALDRLGPDPLAAGRATAFATGAAVRAFLTDTGRPRDAAGPPGPGFGTAGLERVETGVTLSLTPETAGGRRTVAYELAQARVVRVGELPGDGGPNTQAPVVEATRQTGTLAWRPGSREAVAAADASDPTGRTALVAVIAEEDGAGA